MWWRVCKMVADIEVVARPSSKANIDDLFEYFEYTRRLFLDLWLGFVITLERDTRTTRLPRTWSPGCMAHIVPESCGTFRTVQDPDMFPDIDPGNYKKSEEHELDLKSRASKIYWKLRLFFKQSPIGCEDFVLTGKQIISETFKNPSFHIKYSASTDFLSHYPVCSCYFGSQVWDSKSS
jgi:hypothetical protein